MDKRFPEYKNLDLSQINKEVLKTWESNHMFEQSLKTREGSPSFVFFEGPPSANGMPGIHHVMARSLKDIICRYKTLQGFRVERKAGWDTHGLPVELGVEKMLGITKEDIGKKISVDEYNAACRREVMKYTKEWTALTKKMGYWVDLDNPYITYDNKYIETLWWLLKQLYNKGLLYKGYTIQPYSPAAGTGLSSHELNQPGCYRDVKDTTVTAQFKIKGDRFGENAYFLAWTTTPWTLPSNTALCVGPKIVYNIIKSENPYSGVPAVYIMAKELVSNYFGEKKVTNFEVVGECMGVDLVDMEYEQLIPWTNPGEGAFRVIAGDYVTTEDGTGIVHIAPTFGADDAFVAKKAGVPGITFLTKKGEIRPMVDMTGKFFLIDDLDDQYVHEYLNVREYRAYEGRFVKNAYDPNLTDKDESLDVAICMMLKQQGLAFRIEKHVHNYPHCWRTDKPVLYYPLDSWFIKSTACRERMMELNKTINWKPESTGTGRFGKWLENLQDWNLSRSRYWGTPLPIWRTEDGSDEICVGSIEELMTEIEKSVIAGFMKENPYKNFQVGDYSNENYDSKNIDLHRPYVDGIILVSKDGKPMKRETDLIDVWFDSGAMPYAQVHYPFENADAINKHLRYPADFISEGVDQTRGWFFTLHALGTMIFDSVAFKNVISNGLVLDSKGNKMSKRLGNAVDSFEVIEKFGSDPLRWYMITNAQPWDNLKFDVTGVDEVKRKFFGTLYNTYGFFALYANVDKFNFSEPEVALSDRPEIDRWILSLLNSLIKEVTDAYESFEPTRAGRAIQDFVIEDLSNWYVRLSRKRFWGGNMTTDKQSAYQTLYKCLETIALIASPIAPFYCDRLFSDLNSVTQRYSINVHTAYFPKVNEKMIDTGLEERQRMAQQVSSMVLGLRRKVQIRVRQPLAKIMIPLVGEGMKEQLDAVKDIILSEINVKEVEYLTDATNVLVKKIKPNFKTLGPKYSKQMKAISTYFAQMSQADIAAFEQAGRMELSFDNVPVTILSEDADITSEDIPGWLVASEGRITVALDINVTEALKQEGVARELVNRIQNLRKESDFDVTDQIELRIGHHVDVDNAVLKFKSYIASQVLACEVYITDQRDENAKDIEIDEINTFISIKRSH